jgi:uncharacterized damage-inducible protein DinB
MRNAVVKSMVALAVLALALASAPDLRAQTAPSSGFRAEFLSDWDDFSKKAVALAEAMPTEKYSWRPNKDVRSISEIYMHIAGGNFGLLKAAGVQPPEGMSGLEKVTDKEKVVSTLKQSCEHVRKAILNTSDADLDKPATLMGHTTTVRGIFFVLATHQHEHFGLAIAYARATGVVPPWTAARQSQQPHQHDDAKKP